MKLVHDWARINKFIIIKTGDKKFLSNALWPHSCAPRKTSKKVTHPKITPHKARLTVEFLANGSLEKKMHLVHMSSLSISFQVKMGYHTHPHLEIQRPRWTVVSRSFPPLGCTEHTICHGCRVALIPFVTPWPLKPPVFTHGDCRLAPQTNTSLSTHFGLTRAHLENFLGGHPS